MISSEKDSNSNVKVSQVLADSHENLLSQKKLLVVLSSMAVALLLSFVDQTGITVALPYMSDDLKASDTITWAGTSSLISTTVFMVFFGRMSDIFSRKYVLIAAMWILSIFDLACGLAQTPYQLYVFRGFCGIGNGGITSLTMVIVSDIVTLKERGKYQGILGACVGLGNALGPFLASAFISHTSWRYFYYMLCPLIFCASGIVLWLVPYTNPGFSKKEKLKKIDYPGFLCSSIGIIFILIPISGEGSSYEWNSPIVIAMLLIGCVSLILFFYVELKVSSLPMIPPLLFAISPSLTMLLSQNFFFGMIYYSSIYYYPYYFEVVRGDSVIQTSLYLLCLVVPQSLTSVIGGRLISRTGKYIYVIWFGYIMWNLAVCLTLLWKTNSNPGVNVVVLLLNGMGVGATFQPTLVAAQAQSYKKDRATVISTRNVLRSFGGAIGLAICSTIMSNTYTKLLKNEGMQYFSQEQIGVLGKQIYARIELTNYSESQIAFLRAIYMRSMKYLFYFWIASMGICLISMIFVRDNGLQPLDHSESK
ncbi:uncharacterized protein PRCAT00005399001 [Priceomyces carsonii]|uniref:uncharacterized protein n=1 Tax=Priceomyces carsonii TaxID=28549 RepID=UPI002ED841FB|nr:unnamed protein product [Priceomyces carsonii]